VSLSLRALISLSIAVKLLLRLLDRADQQPTLHHAGKPPLSGQ
jgi:hypothetical protein